MNWIFLSLTSALFAAIASIQQRMLMKGDKSNPYSYAVVFDLFLAFINLLFALYFGWNFSLFSGNVFLLFLSSLLWTGAVVLIFRALQVLEASEVIIIQTTRVLVTILASIFFLREAFGSQRIIGAILIIVATFLVSNLKRGFKINAGVAYVLVAALLGGIAIVVDSVNVKHYSIFSYNVVTDSLGALYILIFAPKAMKQWQHLISFNFLKKMIPMVSFSAIQGIAYLFALTTAGVTAQVGTIRQSSVIITVLLAIFFLKEKTNLMQKIIATVLVTIGVILLS